MKKPTPLPRASHVNSGTSIDRRELRWPDQNGTVLRHRKLHLEHDKRPDVTPLGGLVLPLALLRRFKVAQHLDARVDVLKLHLPFHESDHILAQALMLYAGGSCLEDLALLQQDPALLKMLGAVRTPDPTTAGDFLRRFVPAKKLEALRSAIDEIQDRVWANPKRWRLSRRRKTKRPLAVLYLDGHLKQLSGVTREGANFSYKGKWSAHARIDRRAQACRRVDISKSRRELGYRPTSMREAMQDAHEFYVRQGMIGRRAQVSVPAK